MALIEKPEYDLPIELAKTVIMRHIVATLVSDRERVGEMWEDYPEIGEHDWIDICSRLPLAWSTPSKDEFDRAYAHLSERAEH